MNKQFPVRDVTYIAAAAALIAACAWISVPADPPFTLQTFAIFFAVGLLGGRRGTLALVVYLLLAAAGLPVLAGFRGGLGALLGTTGGYLLGFLVADLLLWASEKLPLPEKTRLPLGMLVGLLSCYAFGTVWFVRVYAQNTGAIGYGAALARCVLPFVIPDLLKIAAALALIPRVRKLIRL